MVITIVRASGSLRAARSRSGTSWHICDSTRSALSQVQSARPGARSQVPKQDRLHRPAQLVRDSDGNCVGNGDMRAQMDSGTSTGASRLPASPASPVPIS
jgi:ribosomal protein L34E